MAKTCGLLKEKACLRKDLSLDEQTAHRSGDTWQNFQKPGAATHNQNDQGESARSVSLFGGENQSFVGQWLMQV